MAERLELEVERSLAGLLRRADEWNALLAASAADGVFLRAEWLAAWIETYLADGEPCLLFARDGAELVGGAPFCLRRAGRGPLGLRRLGFLGAREGGADRLDVVARRGREAAVAGRVGDWLYGAGRQEWDELELFDVPAASPVLLHLLAGLDASGRHARVELGAYCPTRRLPASGGALEAQLSARQRKRLRWEERTLDRVGPVEHVVLAPGAELEAPALRRFFALHARRFGSRPDLEALLRRVCARSAPGEIVRVDVLAVAGRDVAALLHLRHRDRLSLYGMAVDRGFDPRVSVGNVLLHRCLEAAVAQKLSTYDFLKGVEAYKLRWADGGTRSLIVRTSQRRPAPLLHATARALRDLAKVWLR